MTENSKTGYKEPPDDPPNVKVLQAAIDEGLASGVSFRSLNEILAEARARAQYSRKTPT